jgi:hypothetical protein
VIVPHKDELLFVAINEAKAMFNGATAPPHKRLFPVAGRSGKATIKGSLVNMRDGGFISQHDFHIASLIANVVTGGDVDAGTLVTEEYLMALERKAFCSLLTTPRRRNASWACCPPASRCATDPIAQAAWTHAHTPQSPAALAGRLQEVPAFMRVGLRNLICCAAPCRLPARPGSSLCQMTPERVEMRLANEHRVQQPHRQRACVGHEPAGRNRHRHGGGHECARRLSAAGQGAEAWRSKARHRRPARRGHAHARPARRHAGQRQGRSECAVTVTDEAGVQPGRV